MKISIDNGKRLTVEPSNIADAFELGQLFGEWSEKANVAWGGDGTLHFDLVPVVKDAVVGDPEIPF